MARQRTIPGTSSGEITVKSGKRKPLKPRGKRCLQCHRNLPYGSFREINTRKGRMQPVCLDCEFDGGPLSVRCSWQPPE